ncbi:hypothetical protein EJB05_03637, partial [Eragrostis curvula]
MLACIACVKEDGGREDAAGDTPTCRDPVKSLTSQRGRGVTFAGSAPKTGDMSSPLDPGPAGPAAMDDILLSSQPEHDYRGPAGVPWWHPIDGHGRVHARRHGGPRVGVQTESWQQRGLTLTRLAACFFCFLHPSA